MISIIVPTHNRQELLEQKLQALEAQSGDFEVIVVSSSTDKTRAFLSEYTAPYPLQTIYSSHTGAGPKRNQGARAARGEFLLFSDDDVIPEGGWLEAFAQASKQQAVYLGAFTFKEGRPWKPAFRFGKLGFNNVNGVALGLPRAWFEQVGGFAEWLDGYGGEDIELGYRLLKANHPLRYLSTAKAHHIGPTPAQDLKKARQAGTKAAWMVRYHRDPRLAWELGVHPALLVFKMTTLPWAKNLLGQYGDYELSYAWGAWETRYDPPPWQQ
jgi:GT2 family glycosyltransferase